MPNAAITAIGHFLPPDVLDNAFFEAYLETTDKWIRERTGIRERRILKEGATSDLAAPAIERALAMRGMSPEEIECVIVATVTPDMMFPPTAVILMERCGMKNAWGFDVEAACSGFLFALATGARFIESGKYTKVLVVGADKMTSIADYQDRNTCILFGDAGAAVLLEPTETDLGIRDTLLRCDGSGVKAIYMAAGGSRMPPSHETVDKRLHYMWQDGKAVFKVAVIGMAAISFELMQKNGLTADDVAYLVPHQANLRIIDACADRMGLDRSKVMINIDKYGNTTAATIPLCLSEWYDAGKLDVGMNLVLSSFGAGYTWGAIWLRWSIPRKNAE
jgi:3-oxoacyl-[acyl-carrier-protein] synthase-3